MAEALADKRTRISAMFMGLMILGAQQALAQTLSDPTRPAVGSEQAPAAEGVTTPQVGVGMVVTAKEGVMALVDGHILRVGSRTEGGVVVRIAPDAVFVRATDGKVARMPLYPGISVQPTAQISTETKEDKSRGRSRALKQQATQDRSINK